MATVKIDIGDIADHFEEKFNKLLQVSVFKADRLVKKGTVVDTGRLRFNWQVAENTRSGTKSLLPGKYGDVIPPIDKVNYSTEKIGNDYAIINNLPYAEPVVLGTNLPPSWGGQYRSRQNVPKGWFNSLAKEIKREIEHNANKIRTGS